MLGKKNWSKGSVSINDLGLLTPAKTPLPTPVKSRSGSQTPLKRGTIATPRTKRQSPGTASVKTHQSSAQNKATLVAARDKLADEKRSRFEEIYRRVVAIPTISVAEMEGTVINILVIEPLQISHHLT